MLIQGPLSNPRRWLILLVLLASLLPSGADARPNRQIPNFGGCRSVRGDDWFVEEISVAPFAIAPGASVEPLAPADPDGAEFFARLSNTTETPLYLIEDGSHQRLDFYAPAAPISLTAPFMVRSRIVSGHEELWDNHAGGAFEWRRSSRSAGFISVSRANPGWSLPGYRSLQRDGDGRPADVALPSASYQLIAIYGREVVRIPVMATTRLNPDYNPAREREEQARCDAWGKNMGSTPLAVASLAGDFVRWCIMVPMLVGMGMILMTLAVMVRRLWRERA